MLSLRAERINPVGFQFVALPVDILRRPDLSAAAKLLAAVVMDVSRSARSSTCKLTNASLAARIGRSAASVKRLLAELEAAGLVRRDTLAEGRVRVATVPTWVDRSCATGQASAAQDCATGGSGMNHQVARDQPTNSESPSEPSLQTGSVPSVHGEDRKPSPAEIAAAMRDMLAGRYAPAMFEPGRESLKNSSVTPSTGQPEPDPKALCKRVGVSAWVAGRPTPLPWRPADADDMRRARERRESLRNPGIFEPARGSS